MRAQFQTFSSTSYLHSWLFLCESHTWIKKCPCFFCCISFPLWISAFAGGAAQPDCVNGCDSWVLRWVVISWDPMAGVIRPVSQLLLWLPWVSRYSARCVKGIESTAVELVPFMTPSQRCRLQTAEVKWFILYCTIQNSVWGIEIWPRILVFKTTSDRTSTVKIRGLCWRPESLASKRSRFGIFVFTNLCQTLSW